MSNTISTIKFCIPKQEIQKSTIKITPEDLSTTAQLGLSVISQLDTISQQNFGQSALSILTSTPKTKLMLNPGRTERQNQMRSVVKKVKECIEDTMNETSMTSVMANRLSWKTFDTLRKSALELKPAKKRGAPEEKETQAQPSHTDDSTDLHSEPPAKKCRIGSQENDIDIARLLDEARSWIPNDVINWSELGRRYGLTIPNGGQIIKQILQKYGIPSACSIQRTSRKPRRSKRKLPGNISFPIAKPIKHHISELKKQVESGKLLVGEKVVETKYTTYKVDATDTSKVLEASSCVFAHKIRLLDIRQKLLKKHEDLGLLRNKPDEYYDTLSTTELKLMLEALGENTEGMLDTELSMHLKTISRQRYLKKFQELMSRALLNDQSFIFLDDLVHLLKIKRLSISAVLTVSKSWLHQSPHQLEFLSKTSYVSSMVMVQHNSMKLATVLVEDIPVWVVE
eukprot:Em0007g1303a